MSNDNHCVLLFQLVDEILDMTRGNRIEGRARFIHEDNVRLHRNGPGNAQALHLTAREA